MACSSFSGIVFILCEKWFEGLLSVMLSLLLYGIRNIRDCLLLHLYSHDIMEKVIKCYPLIMKKEFLHHATSLFLQHETRFHYTIDGHSGRVIVQSASYPRSMAAWSDGDNGYRGKYYGQAFCLACVDAEYRHDGDWLCDRVIHDGNCSGKHGKTTSR